VSFVKYLTSARANELVKVSVRHGAGPEGGTDSCFSRLHRIQMDPFSEIKAKQVKPLIPFVLEE